MKLVNSVDIHCILRWVFMLKLSFLCCIYRLWARWRAKTILQEVETVCAKWGRCEVSQRWKQFSKQPARHPHGFPDRSSFPVLSEIYYKALRWSPLTDERSHGASREGFPAWKKVKSTQTSLKWVRKAATADKLVCLLNALFLKYSFYKQNNWWCDSFILKTIPNY